ncbi:hypothetical protein [Saccharopolyspora phatthalungensis]|uniref:Secreted protein n=1 Tax=Saccharopolyspora phatthalungensis TaxID=664693 RepID=A0A840QE10_9PSEU|nr:hypothetical protein [Saccharopolyspora phatthalungensis]MBB5155223.1 hypothetical protein [Saccharopolyspora phatthalungensis]
MRRLLASTLLTGLVVLGAAGTANASDEPKPLTPEQVLSAVTAAIDGPKGPSQNGQLSHHEQHSHQALQQHDVQSSPPKGSGSMRGSTGIG